MEYFRQEETAISKVRNKLSPIVNYFALLKMIDNGEIEPNKIEHIRSLIQIEYDNIQGKFMEELITLIKDDTLW